MAESLASFQKKGGGRLKETVLWTNANPTSNISDGASIPLSQAYTNFSYIKCIFRMSTTNSTTYEALCNKELMDNAVAGTQGPKFVIGGLFTRSYMRFIYRASGVTDAFKITVGTQVNGTGTDASVLIPTQIIGLK